MYLNFPVMSLAFYARQGGFLVSFLNLVDSVLEIS